MRASRTGVPLPPCSSGGAIEGLVAALLVARCLVVVGPLWAPVRVKAAGIATLLRYQVSRPEIYPNHAFFMLVRMR
jgi:hypothetical protein